MCLLHGSTSANGDYVKLNHGPNRLCLKHHGFDPAAVTAFTVRFHSQFNICCRGRDGQGMGVTRTRLQRTPSDADITNKRPSAYSQEPTRLNKRIRYHKESRQGTVPTRLALYVNQNLIEAPQNNIIWGFL